MSVGSGSDYLIIHIYEYSKILIRFINLIEPMIVCTNNVHFSFYRNFLFTHDI